VSRKGRASVGLVLDGTKSAVKKEVEVEKKRSVEREESKDPVGRTLKDGKTENLRPQCKAGDGEKPSTNVRPAKRNYGLKKQPLWGRSEVNCITEERGNRVTKKLDQTANTE